MPWNGEDEMPKAIWYRQLAREQGRSVDDIRVEYANRDELRPKGKPNGEPLPLFIRFDGDWVAIDLRR